MALRVRFTYTFMFHVFAVSPCNSQDHKEALRNTTKEKTGGGTHQLQIIAVCSIRFEQLFKNIELCVGCSLI